MSKWFYRREDQEVGPFDRESLHQLKTAGIIDDHTLVKSAAEDTWRAFGELTVGDRSGEQSTNPDPDAPSAVFYYLDGDRRPVGPFPRETIQKLYDERVINSRTLVSGKGDKQWVLASQFLGLPPEPPKRLPADVPVPLEDALPVRRGFERFALLMGVTFSLYTFYLIPANSRDVKAITGRSRIDFQPLLIFGILTIGILTVVMMCLWAYDLEKHGQTHKTPGRMDYLGTYVVALNVLAFIISLFSGGLAMILGLALGAVAVWLLEKEINLYASAVL